MMILAETSSPALKIGPEAPWSTHFELIVTGFGWVVVTLLILCFATIVVAKLLPKPQVTPKKTVSAPKPSPASPVEPVASPEMSGSIPAHHVAAIAAAVFATMGSSARVVSIQTGAGGWAQEGRRQIFQSHRVR